MKKIVILLGIIIFAIFLRLPQILNDQFPFVFDMGRDMLWVRDIVVLHKPYLIGPWASLEGVFFGPAWYYLLAIPFWFSGGDPKGSVFLVFFCNLFTIILAYFFGRKIKNNTLGLIFALLFAVSPAMVDNSTFAFHANLLPLTTLIFIWSLWEINNKKSDYLILAALMASLNFHFEPATAIFTLLTLLFFIFKNFRQIKNFRSIIFAAVLFLLPFFPQLIFEFRHQFLQSRAVIAYFLGNNKSLGGILPFTSRLEDRISKFINVFIYSTSNVQQIYSKIIFILFIIFTLFLYVKNSKYKKINNFIFTNLFIMIIPFLGYSFLFFPELKGWYLYGFYTPCIFLTGLTINYLIEKKYFLGLTLLGVLVLTNAGILFHRQQNLNIYKGPEILTIQKETIDWIYQDAAGRLFSAFVYTPPIYDYHYQYLFWWYGKKRYGYWPEEYSYLPGKKDYVPLKDKYLSFQYKHQPKKENELIYLIIEPDIFEDKTKGWLNYFSDYQLLKRQKIINNLTVEVRSAKQTALAVVK